MKCVNNTLFVQFSETHNKEFKVGDVTLVRPDFWTAVEGDEETHTKVEHNVNKLLTHPQVATVVADNPKYKVKKGDKVFLHYMAKEWEEKVILDGQEVSKTEGNFIIFVYRNDQFEMVDNTYLGKKVFSEAPKTATGIYLTSDAHKLEPTKVKITHIPEKTEDGYEGIVPGTTVISIDANQYVINIDGEEYIKLDASEIVAEEI